MKIAVHAKHNAAHIAAYIAAYISAYIAAHHTLPLALKQRALRVQFADEPICAYDRK